MKASSSQLSHSASDDFGEFVRALVALGVRRSARSRPKLQRLGRLAGGDEVPAGAAAADVIERGELARDVVRLVVARRRRADETDALGHHGERRQQRDRLEVGDVLHRAALRLDVGLADGDAVGEEDHVELGALRGLRDLDVMLEIDAGVGLRPRMAPGCDVMAGRIEEGAEPELGCRSCHDALRCRELTAARASRRKARADRSIGRQQVARAIVSAASSPMVALIRPPT